MTIPYVSQHQRRSREDSMQWRRYICISLLGRYLLMLTIFSLIALSPPSTTPGGVHVVSATIIAPLPPTSSTSTAPSNAEVSTRKYQSQPALFGMQLEYDTSFDVRLQAIEDDPNLCAGKISDDEQQQEASADTSSSSNIDDDGNNNDRRYREASYANHDANKIVIPQDGSHIALLAKRGLCSFEDKARTALAIDAELRRRRYKSNKNRRTAGKRHKSLSGEEDTDKPIIQFVVVYDDIRRPALVPMSSSDDKSVDNLGLVFVSYDAGNALLDLVVKSHDDAKSGSRSRSKDGGVPITIDATAPWGGDVYSYHYDLYGEDYPREFILAAMAGFFMCLALLGCLLLCAQAGIISTDGNVVVFGRTLADEIMARRTATTSRGERPRLLTEEQVLALPTVQYCASPTAAAAAASPHIARTESLPVSATRSSHLPLERRSASMLDYQARNTFNICDVCIEEYADGEQLLELPCGHRYHTECILPWLTKRSSQCPHCRADVWDADPYAAAEMSHRPSPSSPLAMGRTTEDTYGSTGWSDYTPLRYLRDVWHSSASSLSQELDGEGGDEDFYDSDVEDTRIDTTPLMQGAHRSPDWEPLSSNGENEEAGMTS